MDNIIDVHIHVGHRFEWAQTAKTVWMDTGPYVPALFDQEGRQKSEQYGDVIKREGVFGGILLPEYSPQTAGVMPFERAKEIHTFHPELIPMANLNPHYHKNLVEAFEEQRSLGAMGLKIHPVHGFFYANDPKLYPIYTICEKEHLPVMFHAGTSLMRGAKMRFADPYTFDDVINDFPNLIVILCHGGRSFWYHIAEFMVKNHENVFIDVSGLPPKNLLQYYPSLKKSKHKYLFGSDFPGVPGIRKNYEVLKRILEDEEALELIGFRNAYNCFNFWKEGVFGVNNVPEIYQVINDAAYRYKGFIPEDLYNEPYMSMEELSKEAERIRFYGYLKDMKLIGVMGKERAMDVTLIRHAYVLSSWQKKRIGSALLKVIEGCVDTDYILVGTWKSAQWSIEFYKKHGFETMHNGEELLQKYWDIPKRQIEMSCVLGKRIKGKIY